MQQLGGSEAHLEIDNSTLKIHGGDSVFAGSVTFNNGADVRFDNATFGEFHTGNTVYVGNSSEIRAESIALYSGTDFTISQNAGVDISVAGLLITENSVAFNMGSGASLTTETGVTLSSTYGTTNVTDARLTIGDNFILNSEKSTAVFTDTVILADHMKVQRGTNTFSGSSSDTTIGADGIELGSSDGTILSLTNRAIFSTLADITVSDTATLNVGSSAILSVDDIITNTDAVFELHISDLTTSVTADRIELNTASNVYLTGGELTANAVINKGGLVLDSGELSTSLIGSSVTVNSVVVNPGYATDQLVVSGDYTQGAGSNLIIEVAGNGKGYTYDTVYVTGDVQLAGTLTLLYIDGYAENIDQTYDVLDWDGTLSGEFDTIVLPPTQNSASFWVTTNLYVDGTIKMESTRKYIAIASTNHGKQESYTSSDNFSLGATDGIIGIDHVGLVELTDGADLDQLSITLAKEAGGSAILDVNNNATVTLTNGLTMSNAGPSTLNIESGAVVTMGGDLDLANADVRSRVLIDSASLTASTVSLDTGYIDFDQSSGTLNAIYVNIDTASLIKSEFTFSNAAVATVIGTGGLNFGTTYVDLTVESGSQVSATRVLVNSANNTIRVTGTDSLLSLAGPVDTQIKQGLVIVTDNAQLNLEATSIFGDEGDVTVNLSNAQLTGDGTLTFGRTSGSTALVMTSGAELQASTVTLATDSGTETSVTVESGSIFDATTVILGKNGTATLMIDSSSEVSMNTVTVAQNSAARAQIDTAGTVTADTVVLGSISGSIATLNITDGVVIASEITIGSDGQGAMAQSGGDVTVTTLNIAANSGSNGAYTLTGGSIAFETVSIGSGTGSFDIQLGTVYGSAFDIDDAVFSAFTVFNPNTGIGEASFTGDATFAANSVMNIEIATANRYDYLSVTNTLSSDSNLSVSFREGFSPEGEYTFELFRAGTLDLDFGTVLLPSLPDGFEWNQTQLESEGKLHILYDRNHDTDGDGVINAHDTYPLNVNRSTPNITIVSPEMRTRFEHDTVSVAVTIEYNAPLSYDGYWAVTLNNQLSDSDPIVFQVTPSDDLTVTVSVDTSTIYDVSAALIHADMTRITSSDVASTTFVIKKDLSLDLIVASVSSTTTIATDMDKDNSILDVDGDVIIEDSAQVTFNSIELGTKENADSYLRVRDTSTKLIVETDILVGSRSTLIVETGAALEVSESVMVSGNLLVEEGGTVNVGATLNVENIVTIDGHIRAEVFEVELSATLIGLGGSLSADKISGPDGADIALTLNNFGIAPGQSPGTTIVVGDLVMTDSSYLTMEIASTTNMDRISVLGEFTTDGTLEVQLIDDFVPTMNQVFDIFDWFTINAAEGFDSIILPELPEEITWNVENLFIDGTLTIVTGNVDRDGDGVLDSEDAFPFDPFLQSVPSISATLAITDGLVLWLDATQPHGDAVATEEMKLQTWIDLSGNDNHAEQRHEALRPTRSATSELRNNQAVRGNGTAYFSLPSGEVLATKDAFEVFIVGVKRSNTGVDYALNFGGTELALGSNSAQTLVLQSGNSPASVTQHDVLEDKGYLVNASQSTESGTMTLNTILSAESPDTPATTGSYSTTISDNSRYILSNAGANGWDGEIGEIIIFNRTLSASERAQIEGYLRGKWGLLLFGSVDIFFGTE